MENYSVLMSVYYKEKPEYLRQAMQSIYEQTVPTNDFVLVCDGPLTIELDDVISEMQKKFGDRLHVYRLDKNCGLGIALNYGIEHCKNNLVARMDSDDISRLDRCERQLKFLRNNPQISLLSGTINEFTTTPEKSKRVRRLPESNDSIIKFSKKRNPINHPCVMFKKSDVVIVGGYLETYHLFEDYYLWVRMLSYGFEAYNLNEILLDMRTLDDIYLRRGGFKYAKEMIRFHKWMVSKKWCSIVDFCTGALPHAFICMLPNMMRKGVYERLRK